MHEVETFTEGTVEGWAIQCFTCGYEATGYESLEEAEGAADEHSRTAKVEGLT